MCGSDKTVLISRKPMIPINLPFQLRGLELPVKLCYEEGTGPNIKRCRFGRDRPMFFPWSILRGSVACLVETKIYL